MTDRVGRVVVINPKRHRDGEPGDYGPFTATAQLRREIAAGLAGLDLAGPDLNVELSTHTVRSQLDAAAVDRTTCVYLEAHGYSDEDGYVLFPTSNGEGDMLDPLDYRGTVLDPALVIIGACDAGAHLPVFSRMFSTGVPVLAARGETQLTDVAGVIRPALMRAAHGGLSSRWVHEETEHRGVWHLARMR